LSQTQKGTKTQSEEGLDEFGEGAVGTIGWLVALGCMFIGVFVGVWGYTEFNRTVAIWIVGFPGAVCLLIAAGLELQKVGAEPAPKDNPLRAYVFTDHSEVIHAPGKAPTAIVTIKNSGQTPAYELTWQAEFLVVSVEHENQISMDLNNPATKQILVQGGFLSYTFTFPNWEARFDELLSQEKIAIYSVGKILYKDIDGKERFTSYIMRSGGRFGTKAGIAPDMFGTISVKSN
jgi:hypothetical protein